MRDPGFGIRLHAAYEPTSNFLDSYVYALVSPLSRRNPHLQIVIGDYERSILEREAWTNSAPL
jgi:hypothetical protein